MKHLKKILIILTFGIIFSITASAQTKEDDDGLSQREVLSAAYTNKRPTGRTNTQKRNYRRGAVKPPRRKRLKPRPPKPKTAKIEQVGVTMWRLREEKPNEEGAKLLTQGNQLVGERISLDSAEAIFKLKDKVRISIETTRKGYLYVFDRELKKGDKLGEAYMIFPTLSTRDGNNEVSAGTVVEIPAQSDNPFYFDITPSGDDYEGELITIIVSPTKLSNLPLQKGPIKISTAMIEKWEDDWEDKTAVDNLEEGEGLYSKSEKEAGTGKRLLTREEPPPQTLFSVKVMPSEPILINLKMKVGK